MRTIALMVIFAVAGCQDGKPKAELPPLHPTTGKVVRNGQPAGPGSLQLDPEPALTDVRVSAEVRPDGTFEVATLHTPSGKKAAGAPAGVYKATFMPALGDQATGAVAVPTPVTPGETYTIREGKNELTIEIGKK
jgi:hypothetical protein